MHLRRLRPLSFQPSTSSPTQGLYHLQPSTPPPPLHCLRQLQLSYSEPAVRAILHPSTFTFSSPPNVRQIELGCLCIRATQTPSQPVRRRSCKYFAPCGNLVVITQGPTADPQASQQLLFHALNNKGVELPRMSSFIERSVIPVPFVLLSA
jgi:hypothetical protein